MPPLEDLPSYGGTGGVNDPVQHYFKFSNPSCRNKKTRTSQSQCGAEVIALEKQLCSIVKTAKKTWPTDAFCGLFILSKGSECGRLDRMNHAGDHSPNSDLIILSEVNVRVIWVLRL